MKAYSNKFKAYLNDLASRKPSPGGGSVACLLFCQGLSLIEKSLNYSSVLKVKTAKEITRNKKIKKTLKVLQNLRIASLPVVDKDGYIFEKIMSSKPAQRKKLIKISEALIIELANSCIKAISLAKKVESDIKNIIISDYNIGRDCLLICLKGCLGNLKANEGIFGKKNKNISKIKKYLKNDRSF